MSRVVIVGGSVIDLFLYPHQKMKLKDSNPGYLKKSLGGVGRNIAENLARLGLDVTLITPLGHDSYKDLITNQAQQIGLSILPIDINETPTYVSVIDEKGEDLIGVALMDEIQSITIDQVLKHQSLLDEAELLVLDTNLSEGVLRGLLERYKDKTYVDAISGQKAFKLKTLLPFIHTLKMNLIEAKTIAGFGDSSCEGLDKLGDFFISKGTREVFITLGDKGVYYANREVALSRSSVSLKPINSTGAGDAFFSGVIYATLHQKDHISYGIANAYLNLLDEKAVCQNLSSRLIENTVKELNL
ncbi:MAG: carbohydrate kinase family protein [Acholeplasmataceae bacterium]|jgi:pseudouridine kinase|nr:carbohydrate kinase family protein [Acholeplasmataceae bacterium]